MPAAEMPPSGFRRSGTDSGLILPEAIAREREVWTKAEWMTINRAFKLLESRGVHIYLKCTKAGCEHAPMESVRQSGGTYLLRCDHKDRVFQRVI